MCHPNPRFKPTALRSRFVLALALRVNRKPLCGDISKQGNMLKYQRDKLDFVHLVDNKKKAGYA